MYKKISGIYKITNIINNKYYIGSGICVSRRINDHKKREHNIHLKRSFNKYGLENFTFEIIEECEKENLLQREQYYINTLKPEYNICKIAGNTLGRFHSEETRQKIKQKCLGRKLNDALKRNCELAKQGKFSGELNPNSFLLPSQILEIRAKYKPKVYTMKMLAKEFSTTAGYIKAILYKRVWKNI